MLTAEQWKMKQYEFRFPAMHTRQSGKSFRMLLQAAHAASLGDTVTVYCGTERMAKHMAHVFHGLIREPVFAINSGDTRFDCIHNDGHVKFRSIGSTYDDYIRTSRGDKSQELFDV